MAGERADAGQLVSAMEAAAAWISDSGHVETHADGMRRSPPVLDPDAPITADLLRTLTREQRVLARLEMTWGRRDQQARWVRHATDVLRVYRGMRARRQCARLLVASRRRALSVRKLGEAQSSLASGAAGREARALACLREAAAADPRCGDVALVRAEVLYGARRYAEAADELAFFEDTDLRCELLKGRAACALGRWEAAEEALSLVIEREPPPVIARRAGGAGAGARVAGVRSDDVAPAAANDAEHSALGVDDVFAHARFLRGCARAKLQDYLGAEVDFAKWLDKAPELPKRPPQMKRDFDVYQIHKRHRAKALECLGLALAANRRWNEAVSKVTAALLLAPCAPLYCVLARIHCCERCWALAEDRYADALLLEPNLQMAIVGLEQARIQHEPLPLYVAL
ncbi:hypothetical protein M885DRAFT_520847 [Pelagophyceae sp. CCMP2097]|nr:hypothetical protein M885DRAFT_520847 [Pelagophyceae sp. CCMP2097]